MSRTARALRLGVVALVSGSVTLSLAGVPRKVAPLKGLAAPGVRLLVFEPHPDDATLGVGGLIQRIARHGGAVRVVVMTSGDGFPPGVALETHNAHPRPEDYRAYAHRRERETIRALGILGVARRDIVFLGFPDRGLCPILQRFRVDRPPYYRSPFTDADRPPVGDALVPDAEYDAVDLERELRRVIVNFRPTLIVVPHGADEHPDHCSTYFFVRDAVHEIQMEDRSFRPTLVAYLIHFDGWPARSEPSLIAPAGFPDRAAWEAFPLSEDEVARKREAVAQFQTQMDSMRDYLLGFVRQNELFLVDPPPPSDDARQRCCGR